MTEDTIGIDISKIHLDAFRQENQAVRQFENTSKGIWSLNPLARQDGGSSHRLRAHWVVSPGL